MSPRFSTRIFLALAFFRAVSLNSAVVVTSLENDGPGSLRAAIASAPADSTITFDPALSGGTIELAYEGLFVTNSVTIDASGLAQGVTISGSNEYRIFGVMAPDFVLKGVTLTKGRPAAEFFYPGTVTVTQCKFVGNDQPMHNRTTLTLEDCLFATNNAGGIFNGGYLLARNCTFKNNNGGGIYNYQDCTVTVRHSLFSGNIAGQGGGIYNRGELNAFETTFLKNDANEGGAIYSEGKVTLNTCELLNNSASTGGALFMLEARTICETIMQRSTLRENLCRGASDNLPRAAASGIYCVSGMLKVSDSLIASNVVSAEVLNPNNSMLGICGGIMNESAKVNLVASTISANIGGGIYNRNGELYITNCTIVSNTMPVVITGKTNVQSGAGIYNGNTAVVHSSTIVGNVVQPTAEDPSIGSGGGIYNVPYWFVTCSLTNSIVALNGAPSDPDIDGSFKGDHNFVTSDPGLRPLGNYGGIIPTMPPASGSPVINAGAKAPDADARGYLRSDGSPDIGAVEFGAAAPEPVRLQLERTGYYRVKWTTPAGLRYTVYGSEDARQWDALGTSDESPASDNFGFQDFDGFIFRMRFYKVTSP